MANQFRLKAQKLQLSENDVREACLDVLRAHQWWPIRQHVGRFILPDRAVLEACGKFGVRVRWHTAGEKGDPDYAVLKAPSFFVELKRPGGELSDEQRARIYALRQFYDLETAVVESVEELIEWLDRHQRSP
jgi:hypothetical protein